MEYIFNVLITSNDKNWGLTLRHQTILKNIKRRVGTIKKAVRKQRKLKASLLQYDNVLYLIRGMELADSGGRFPVAVKTFAIIRQFPAISLSGSARWRTIS